MSEALKKKSFEELYEELCALPENVIGEIINGELIVSPRPAPKHANSASGLTGILREYYQYGRNGGPGGWWILIEPQIEFPEKVVVPDIAGWKKSKMPSLPDKAYFNLAPDWVCEVLSPSTARYDRISKLQVYANNGITDYWILDPVGKVLETYSLEKGGYKVGPAFSGNDIVKTSPFSDFEFDLGDLWAD